MGDLDELFERLSRSSFRRRFRLGAQERAYLRDRGVDTVMDHARRFVTERLQPAEPAADGRQTPMHGHPAFIAQHATATCCRSCLSKWHGIAKGRALSDAEVDHVLAVIRRWLAGQDDAAASPRPGSPIAKDGDRGSLFD